MSRFFMISLPVTLNVWYKVGKSRVEVKMSNNPNGSINGIHPASNEAGSQLAVRKESVTPTPSVL
jgi:hypothetical protein